MTLLIGLLAACATGPGPQGPSADRQQAEYARELAAQGEHAEAAALYEQLARAASDPATRQSHWLAAAEAWFETGQSERAQELLARLPATLTGPELARSHLLQAALALQQQDPGRALDQLREPGPDTPELRRRYHALRAQAYAMGGFPENEAEERIALDALLLDQGERLRNQKATLQALGALHDSALAQLADAQPPDALTPWARLARIVQGRDIRSDAFVRQLAEWQAQYPFHPAAGLLAAALLEEHQAGRTYPDTVALILPFSGPLGAAGQAVRDGLLAAYHQDRDTPEKPRIRLYDSSEADVASLYRQAVADGAQAVIGPLEKDHVARLAQQLRPDDTAAVTILALNAADTPSTEQHPHLYQFGLLPEDEARQVAERAWREGHRRALTLVPEGEWGARLRTAFAEHWTGLGGTLLESGTFSPDATDFSATLTTLLNLDQSQARYRSLNQVLRRSLNFEPRRRQDADFLFLAAQAPQARSIQPQLDYHYAQDLPVYATSHVYAGQPQPQLDHDLNGVLFTDTPWTLNASQDEGPGAELASLWPARSAALGRLIALGWDAYRVLPLLPQLKAHPARTVAGQTGTLSVDAEGRVHRELSWARFAGGLAKPDPAPPPLTATAATETAETQQTELTDD